MIVDTSALVATLRDKPEAHVRIARDAYHDFGKGRDHPAQRNFGDCFAYALARAPGEPLLFKGDDFPHTDIVPIRLQT